MSANRGNAGPMPDGGFFRPGSALGPFRFVTYRAAWLAFLASNTGSAIQLTGAVWLMTDIAASHRMIALVPASSFLPIMLFGLFTGALADSFDRRHLMLWAQAGMLLASAALTLLTFLDRISPLSLLALVFAIGACNAANAPAWQASVRTLVGQKDLPDALSLNAIAFNTARGAGPVLGGLIISIWTVGVAFAVNTVSFLFMIAVLLRWKPVVVPRRRKPVFKAISIGLAFGMRNAAIRNVLLRAFVFGFGTAALQALLPSVVKDVLGGGGGLFGFALGLFGAGAFIGALGFGFAQKRFGPDRVFSSATALFVFALAFLAVAQNLPLAMISAFLGGAAWVAGITTVIVTIQMSAPAALLGRSTSLYQTCAFGGMALGAWLWGVFADWQGLTASLLLAAAWLVLVLLILCRLTPMPQDAAAFD